MDYRINRTQWEMEVCGPLLGCADPAELSELQIGTEKMPEEIVRAFGF